MEGEESDDLDAFRELVGKVWWQQVWEEKCADTQRAKLSTCEERVGSLVGN